MFIKTLKRIAISGLISFIFLVPSTGPKAGERSSTFSSGSSEQRDGKTDIFDPDLWSNNPEGKIVGADIGRNKDQVCGKCGETGEKEVIPEIDKLHNRSLD